MDAEILQATGIVAEYNPFHNGHLHHLQEAKRLTQQPVIAIMSASFMQRGEPAFADKWLRARLAVCCGADLVLELPAAFSLSSAEFFARGAVKILLATGCVNRLCCGAETPARDFLSLARAIQQPEAQLRLRKLMQQGAGYAAACAQVLPAAYLSAPNDILALEYSKALLGTPVTPLFIQRRAASYNDSVISGTLASASSIRQNYLEGGSSWQQTVPPAVLTALLQNICGCSDALLWQLLSYRLRLLSAQQIAQRCQCSEGLENLLKQTVNCSSLSEALAMCTNKRYSTSRIRRLFIQLLLDQPRDILQQGEPAYLRVLAFNETGRVLLKQMKRTALLPILTKLGRNPERKQSAAFAQQLKLELAATDVWSLLQKNPQLRRSGQDFLQSPAYIN